MADKDKSQRSQRVVMKDDEKGEQLQECSDREWESSEGAYSVDLLNVKKKPNRVTVFAAPKKMVDSTGKSIRQVPTVVKVPDPVDPVDQRLRGLAKLVTGVAKILLEEEKDVEVTVSLKIDRKKKSLDEKNN